MKNLNLQRLVSCELSGLKNISPHFCADPDPTNFDVYFYQDGIVHRVCTKRDEVLESYSLEHLYPGDIAEVIGMSFVSILSSVYLVLENGDIVGLENGKFEFIGDVPSGLQAMEWSPDEELVVLISGDNKAILMTSRFDSIIECDYLQEGFGEKQFITVGWGKKETQFHGSEGKAAAKAPQQQEATPAYPWDDLRPRVRWRGDGTLFAISYINPVSGGRQIRMFSREGSLQYTSENCPGLEHALDWKPSGSLITSTQRLPNKHLVAFFEKNGLRHGEISLPFQPNEVMVRELKWNSESTVLAVWCEGLESTSDTKLCCLQLWASTNYSWYLKQSLDFSAGQKLLGFAWDKDSPTCLHVVLEGPLYLQYVWKWSVDRSSGVSPDDAASVTVIDGAQIKVTNFRDAVVPPPMCAFSLKLPRPATSVAFASPSNNQSTKDICVILNDDTLALFTEDASDREVDKSLEVIEGVANNKHNRLYPHALFPLDSGDVKLERVPLGLHHWLWIRKDIVLCVAPQPKYSSKLLVFELKDQTAFLRRSIPIEAPVLGLCAIPGTEDAAVFTEKKYWRLSHPYIEDAALESLEGPDLRLAPSRCLQYTLLEVEGKLYVLGLTTTGQVTVNDRVALKNCTSLLVHPQFLLLTTLQHQLCCVPRTIKAMELLQQRGSQAFPERLIERGARLIATVPSQARIIMQMPRGNLEAIEPRALALHIVHNLLDQSKYAEAFALMRRQRINMNIFYDHDPPTFMENIKEFVLQLKTPTWLCLFLSELSEINVTTGMYAGHYVDRIVPKIDSRTPKSDLVCHKMRRVLEEVDREGLVLPVISTFIKQAKPDIGAALQRIRDTKAVEIGGGHCKVSSDEALVHLMYIVDVYELFDIALGLYDFDLVMLVAAKSQKDPKEYIPFLNELRKLEENYRKFTIDKHLKKFVSALRHLCACGTERSEECMAFIKTHKLHAEALTIFPKTHVSYKPLCEMYGELLLNERRPHEAGIMFNRSGLYSKAAESFRKAGSWQNAIALVPKLGLSKEELRNFYRIVAHELREHKRHEEAALVFGEFLQDSEERVVSLSTARAWQEALRIATTSCAPLVDEVIRPGVKEHCSSVEVQLETWQEQLEKYVARLIIVRTEKARRQEEEGDEELGLNSECDMFSDTSSILGSSTQSRSSGASRQSSKSYRSSKNKRKHERKLLSLKEGNPYEDLALIRALHELYTGAYHMRGEVHALNLALLHFELDALAAALQAGLVKLLESMTIRQAEIWTPEFTVKQMQGRVVESQDSVTHGVSNAANPELEPHYCLPPVPPHISTWKLNCLRFVP